MLRGQLTTLLGLLSGVWLPTGSGRPGTPSTPAQAGTAANQSWTLDPLVPASALGSWKTFLGLQDRQQGAGGLQGGQREAAAVSLPLLPQEVLQETCKTVAFIQVSRSGGAHDVSVNGGVRGGDGDSCFGQSTGYVALGRLAIKSQVLNPPFKCP